MRIRKAIQFGMLPENLADPEKLALAKRCGFEGIEAPPIADLDAAKRLGDTARAAGVPVHSIIYGGWGAPLSDPSAEVAAQGLAGMETALRSARAMGADAVLLVPGLVTDTVGYAEAYDRSQERIRKLLPLAEETGVVIAVENVWNRFLLSPVEFARYVDDFDSPWLRAYLDVGNMILFGFAQDWVETLGERIAKIHLKDFRRDGSQWVNLGDGDVNWAATRDALASIPYDGFVTPELPGGEEAYLMDLSGRIENLVMQ
jgi:L-ribulose-5-phosphate 3-epimerase